MQKLLIGVFVATCGMFVMGACTPTETGDAGVEDAGGEGEGEGEGDPQPGVEGDPCNPSNAGACETGLLCVPSTATAGVCRVDCSAGQTCPSGKSCQDAPIDATGTLGEACLTLQATRDGACQAFLDPDACADDMSCLLTNVERDDDDVVIGVDFNCKVTCDLDADNADAQCGGDERCMMSPSGLFQGIEPDPANPEESLVCTVANCEEGGTGCECDAAGGFDCWQTTTSDEGKGICASIPGQCATPTPPIAASQLVPGGVPNEFICNSVEGHAFCDDSMVASDEEGLGACIAGVFGDTAPNDGLCLAICSTPDTDDNQDGTIATKEAGESFGCNTGWECTLDASRELLVGPGIDDDSARFGIKECSSANCTEDEPCEAECGAGDYECIDVEVTDATGNPITIGLCIAPLGSCEPAVAETDGGPEVDAGGDEPDAGGDEVDAGGDDEVDAGAEDAGVTDAN